jgi:carbonic anhydrase/acetyltransferase-like protein (isoleucine patch superfamily)
MNITNIIFVSKFWFHLKGDVNYITIGDNVNIGDRSVIHCAGIKNDFPTIIENNVQIGAGSIIHGCTLESDTFIGDGAQVMDGAKVSKFSIVAPGAIVTPGKTIPSKQYWSGVPAAFEREVTDEELEGLSTELKETLALATLHAQENAKSFQTIEEEDYNYEQKNNRADYYYKQMTPEVFFLKKKIIIIKNINIKKYY